MRGTASLPSEPQFYEIHILMTHTSAGLDVDSLFRVESTLIDSLTNLYTTFFDRFPVTIVEIGTALMFEARPLPEGTYQAQVVTKPPYNPWTGIAMSYPTIEGIIVVEGFAAVVHPGHTIYDGGMAEWSLRREWNEVYEPL
jgi:hypothetical protein